MDKSPHASPHWVREFFFWSGIVATFAYRIIVIVNNYSKYWAQISWYIGTVGFIIYFWHRYKVSEKRSKLIKEQDLIAAVARSKVLTQEQIDANEYILNTLLSTKEKWNYIFIFIMSIVAMIIGLYLDFFSKL